MATQVKNIILLLIMVLGSVSICSATKYEYDGLNRLSKVIYDDGNKVVYSYDASGNRSEKVVALRVDLNIDGSVGFPDLDMLAAQWLQSPAEPSADVAPWPNLDEIVDFKDFAALAYFWLESRCIRRGEITVDGIISDDEWADADWIPLDTVYDGQPDDVNEAFIALRWDGGTDKVYAAIIVQDNDPNFRDDYGAWDASDRIEVYSQGTAAGGSEWGDGGSRHYDIAQQYYVAPGDTLPQWASWAHGVPLGPDVGLEYIVRLHGRQIIYEIGVPMFDNYGGRSGGETIVTELATGSVIGFDIVVCTRHSAGFGMLSENGMHDKYKNADYFAKYVLVE